MGKTKNKMKRDIIYLQPVIVMRDCSYEEFYPDKTYKSSLTKQGWILCGTGSALLLRSIIDFSKKSVSGSEFWGYAIVAGIFLDVSSIPFFISSSANKRKANFIINKERLKSRFRINQSKQFFSAELKINL